MPDGLRDRHATPGSAAWPLAIAVLLAGGAYLLWGDLYFALGDESFLWYGVVQTARGEIPLRDFQSYEPGRYYWAAAWSLWLGDGILALRLSTVVFQTLGLCCGILVLRRVVSHPAWLLPGGLVLVLWMFPRHKLFEPALAMMAVYVAVRLVEARSLRWHFLAGAFVGLASCFGRNHGLYAGLGLLLLALWLHWKLREGRPLAKLATMAAGGLVGAAPLLGMLALVPGFAESFFESLRFFVERGPNLPKPIPWPWRARYGALPWPAALGRFCLGVGFLLLPLVYAVGVASALRSGRERLAARGVLVAATAIGIFYAHHAAVRSDAYHLAQCIHPMLLAFMALPRALGFGARIAPKLAVWLAMLGLAGPVAWTYSNVVVLRKAPEAYVPHPVGRDTLRLTPSTARYLGGIQEVVARHVPADAALFVAPIPLYPALGRSSPLWQLFLAWEADPSTQQAMIRRLDEQGVDWVLVLETAVGGKQKLRFEHTHAQVWRHLEQEFVPVIVAGRLLPRGAQLLRRRPGGEPEPALGGSPASR